MKELSIEQKAKAYDEALGRAREMEENSNGMILKKWLWGVFPELKESEDEKVRKEIIDYISRLTASPDNIDKYNTWIAWLEKQETSYTKRDVDDAYLKGVRDTKNEIEKQYEANYQTRKDIATFIFNYRGNIKDRTKWMEYLGIKVSFVEKQGEQSADKVEPKFQNGQWIVWKNKWYKVNYNGCGYELIDQKGLKISLEYGTVDESARIWNIHDAREGDVLASKDGLSILIFRNLDTSTSFSSYYNIQGKGELGWSNECFIPATKEQRDLLFQKMKEAGYKWDAWKKEPKKIEQKLAWGEEDEMIALSIEQVMNCASLLNIVPEKIDKIRTWLKSIKDRYTWNPSEEQIEILDMVLTNEAMDDNIAKILRELREQLKKLREESYE